MEFMASRLGAVAAVALIGACGPVAPPVTPEVVARARRAWPEVTVPALEAGRSALLDRCSACHAAPASRDQAASAWPEVVHRMAPRAGLSAVEERALASYLVAAGGS